MSVFHSLLCFTLSQSLLFSQSPTYLEEIWWFAFFESVVVVPRCVPVAERPLGRAPAPG